MMNYITSKRESEKKHEHREEEHRCKSSHVDENCENLDCRWKFEVIKEKGLEYDRKRLYLCKEKWKR